MAECGLVLADNRQAQTATGTEASVCVTKVMQANAIKASMPGDNLPRPPKVGARFLGIVGRHDVRGDTFQSVQTAIAGAFKITVRAARTTLKKPFCEPRKAARKRCTRFRQRIRPGSRTGPAPSTVVQSDS
jgi:hypothetical protein